MRFGLFFVHQLPRPWDADAEQRLFDEGLAQIELADRLGFDSAWVVEQHFLEEYSHSSAPEVFLAAASQRTDRIRLGHGVVLMPPPYNAPARVAERIATLDLVSHGRIDFGVGDSKSRMELEGFGVRADDRRAMSAEALEQVLAMLSSEPYAGYEGKWFSMPVRNVVPKPVQKPHPPVWMACSDDATIHRAAQLGIGALAHAFLDGEEARRVVADYYDTLTKECAPIGACVNANVAMLSPYFCSRDDAALQGARDAHGFMTYAVRHYYTFGRHRPGRTHVWRLAEATREELGGPIPLRGMHLIGTPEQIIASLHELDDAGVDQVVFSHQAGRLSHDDICASLELFAADVMPAFGTHRERVVPPAVEPAHIADDEIPVVEAYGRNRPPGDVSPELERLKEIALRSEEKRVADRA